MVAGTCASIDDDLKPIMLRLVASNASLMQRLDDPLEQHRDVLAQNKALLERMTNSKIRKRQSNKGWHDPSRARWGCFLPDLTRLASDPSAPARSGMYSRAGQSASRGMCGA
jgi:hypothetical protein